MERTAFGGKLTVLIMGNNMKSIVVANGMKRAIPEWAEFDGEEAILFANLVIFLSRIKNITPSLNETDENILALMDFWADAQVNSDYRAIWNQFLYLDPLVNNELIQCLNASLDERLKAPAIVNPNAPSDEVLEVMPDGQSK